MGVFCLTEKSDNLLMWSHYADRHRGFCIEFNGLKLNDFILIKSRKEKPISLLDVVYNKELPSIPMGNKAVDLDDLLKFLRTKYEGWKYEDEWRIIATERPNESIKIPNGIITSIRLGLLVKENDIYKIITCLRDKPESKIKLFRAKRKFSEYGLEFEEIHY